MAFRVRNDEKTEFWLKEKEGEIVLIARTKQYKIGWCIATVTERGMKLHKIIIEDLGFEKDSENRIKII